ncbi:MAG: S1 RNA-binding domain-containing protein [bacterium]
MTDNKTSNFGQLLDKFELAVPEVGETVTGRVISASKAEVRLDINGVQTGVVRGRELYFEADEYANLQPGDEIVATVVDQENENGELELSFRYAGEAKAWDTLLTAFKNKESIKVKVKEANRGGLLVSYMQVSAFLPVSQLSPENYPRVSGGDKNKILEKLKSIIGTELEVKIITLEKEEEKLVVSEKEAWQEKQSDVIAQYTVGTLVKGTITAITNFGVFINFGENLEGLIHISELAWQRIDDPADLYKVSDIIEAEIINIDGSKIFLSAKKLKVDPWKDVAAKYQIGQIHKGTVLKINPFGLFVELDKDIHGLAHISQLDLAPGQKIDQAYQIEKEYDFTIMSVVPEEHRLGLASINHKPEASEKTTAKAKKVKTETVDEPKDKKIEAETTEVK